MNSIKIIKENGEIDGVRYVTVEVVIDGVSYIQELCGVPVENEREFLIAYAKDYKDGLEASAAEPKQITEYSF